MDPSLFMPNLAVMPLKPVDGLEPQKTCRHGRCHSCNRIDTPKWRDWPDSPRTQCNACGRPYKKPERKRELESRRKLHSAQLESVNRWSPSDDNNLVSAPWYECPGTLNGCLPVNALPDYGSSVNAISEQFATRHRLRIVPTTREVETINLVGHANRAESIGRIFASFRFQGELQAYWREFHVLRKSLCDVILGRSFLAETDTLTKFTRRITERVRLGIRKCDRLFLLDESPKDRIRCSVNGAPATALPDTGSDLMLVSGGFVERHGFKVHVGEDHRREVELINGSTIWTDGTVLGAKLEFDVPPFEEDLPSLDHSQYTDFATGLSSQMGKKGSSQPARKVTTFVCDLHVVRDLPCDVILSGEFIFKNKVFTKFHGLFMNSAEAELPLGAGGITPEDCLLFVRKRLKRWAASRRRSAASVIPGTTIPTPTTTVTSWEEKWRAEEERRNQISLWLEGLPEAEKVLERTKELQRRAIWEVVNPRP